MKEGVENFIVNIEELSNLIKQGEGYNLEFKENIDKSLSKELVAFTNSSGGKILLGITDEGNVKGIKITNKGALLFDKKYLGKISLPRNPILFDLFHRVGLIEKVGSGISRIKGACRSRGIRVNLDTGEFFIATFYRRKTTQKTTQKIPSLTKLESKILNLINKDNKISQRQIAQDLKLSINTVKEYIKKLKKKKSLKRIGPDKGGYWKVYY